MEHLHTLKNEIAKFKLCVRCISVPFILILLVNPISSSAQDQAPDELKFVRQGVQRMIFDEDQSIPLAKLHPGKIIGLEAMHPITHYTQTQANVNIKENKLFIQSERETQTGIWFGGFNPFATYTIDLTSSSGEGEIGFEFSSTDKQQQFFIKLEFKNKILGGVKIELLKKCKDGC